MNTVEMKQNYENNDICYGEDVYRSVGDNTIKTAGINNGGLNLEDDCVFSVYKNVKMPPRSRAEKKKRGHDNTEREL